jgi:hypothetical protein
LWVDLFETQTLDPPPHIWQETSSWLTTPHDILLTDFRNKNGVSDPRCGSHVVLLQLLLSLLVCVGRHCCCLSWNPNDILLVSSSMYHNNMQLFWFLHVFYMFMYPILHVGLNWFLNLGLPSLQNLFVVVMEQTHTMGSSSSSSSSSNMY